MRTRYLAVLMAATAIVVRVTPLTLVSGIGRVMDPNTDSEAYVALATGLQHGCGFARTSERGCVPLPEPSIRHMAMRVGNVNTFPELMRTPGYPIFLSLMP